MSKQVTEVPVAIGAGASLSAGVAAGGRCIVGIKLPSGWTTAAVTLQALIGSTGTPVTETYGNVVDETGTEYATSALAASTYVAFTTKRLEGMSKVKVRSGTSGTPVNQGSAVSVILVLGD